MRKRRTSCEEKFNHYKKVLRRKNTVYRVRIHGLALGNHASNTSTIIMILRYISVVNDKNIMQKNLAENYICLILFCRVQFKLCLLLLC